MPSRQLLDILAAVPQKATREKYSDHNPVGILWELSWESETWNCVPFFVVVVFVVVAAAVWLSGHCPV